MSHNHGCCGHKHGGPDVGQEASDSNTVAYGLYQKIKLDQVQCLNEEVDGSGKNVFKPYESRLDKEKFVESDADEELLFNIPFNGNVKLKAIIVIGGEDDTHPNKMRLFKNREHMTFDACGSKADQEFELVNDQEGRVEYATKMVTFSNVYHLSLHFPSNYGGDTSKIYYIGLKGEWTAANRVGVVNAVYEARPMMQDHKQDTGEKLNFGNPGF